MEMAVSSEPEDGENSNNSFMSADDNNGGSSSSEEEEVEEDRLSSLPNALLVEILSLLPIQSAAATSVLSQRWRHLWTQVTRLRISRDDSALWESYDCRSKIHKLCSIIHRIFRRLTSPKIQSFYLDLRFTPAYKKWKSCGTYLKSWIHHLCDRNVEELEVRLLSDSPGCLISLPTRIFETQSLVVLKLTGLFTHKLLPDQTISLPNLKKLTMNYTDRNRNLMRLLFHSCPLLEDLCLYVDWERESHFVDISAQNMKRLTIVAKGSSEGSCVKIDTPRLEDFDISNSSLAAYFFVRDLKGLLKASIVVEWEWEWEEDRYYLDKLLEIVQGISNARSLNMSSLILDSLHHLHDRVLPIFYNLTHLSTSFDHPHGWNSLLRFLHWAPNLEVLDVWHDGEAECDTENMDWTIPKSVPVCLLNKLKRVEIGRLQGCQKELDFLHYVLSNASVLERLVLCDFYYFGEGELCKELYCENLFSCPRSSVICEIEVSGEYFNASSKGFNEDTLDC